MASKRRTLLAISLAVLVVIGAGSQAFSQDVEGKKLPQLWEDFIHYVKIARPDLAKSYGQAILDSDADAREIYRLSEQTRDVDEVLQRAERQEDLKSIVAEIRKMMKEGFRAESASAEEIKKSIEMLDGSLTEYREAARRLRLSGEYALPQLIGTLQDSETSPIVRERIITILPRLGPEAVRGMSAALQSDSPTVQEAVANALGRIQYYHAAVALKDLYQREDVLQRVRQAAEAALMACAGRQAPKRPMAVIAYNLAEKYYYRADSIRPDQRYDTANVWFWEDDRLTYVQVPREIFCDVYAMRYAQASLASDQSYEKAASLWLAANLNRQANLPSGAEDPTWENEKATADFYALASGPRYMLDVLQRGLRDGNTPVAIGAIEALAKTAGAKSLLQHVKSGAQPLVNALTFSDARVRFLAAEALADAHPQEKFEGSQIVVTVLNEALRQTGEKTAIVSVDVDRQNEIIDAVRAAGYKVIAEENQKTAFQAGRRANGVDLVVLAGRPNPADYIRKMRNDPEYIGTPVVVIFQTAELRSLAEDDEMVVLLPSDAQTEAIKGAISEAAELGIGKPLTERQASQWAIRVSETARQLSQTDNPVYDVQRLKGSLIMLTTQNKPDVQSAAAAALAVMNAADAQQAIAQLAVLEDAENSVRLDAFSLLSASLRQFGNKLTDSEISAVQNVVKGDESEAMKEAAAQAYGAMNLPSQRVKSLILNGG